MITGRVSIATKRRHSRRLGFFGVITRSVKKEVERWKVYGISLEGLLAYALFLGGVLLCLLAIIKTGGLE